MNDGRPGAFVRHLLFLLAAPLVWFAHFSLVYGAASFGAAFGAAASTIRFFVWGATFAAVAAIVALLLEARTTRSPIAAGLAGLSLFAVLLLPLALWIVPAGRG